MGRTKGTSTKVELGRLGKLRQRWPEVEERDLKTLDDVLLEKEKNLEHITDGDRCWCHQ